MGQSKEEKALTAQLTQAIADLKNPKTNPAQDYLTQQALSGADTLNRGDFTNLPKGMFFDFKNPTQQMSDYDKYTNVGKEGIYALGGDGGPAVSLASDYRKNKFARDAANSYQSNVANASTNIQNALQQSAGAKSMNDQQVIGALQNMYNSAPKGFSWSNLLGQGIGAGASLAKFI